MGGITTHHHTEHLKLRGGGIFLGPGGVGVSVLGAVKPSHLVVEFPCVLQGQRGFPGGQLGRELQTHRLLRLGEGHSCNWGGEGYMLLAESLNKHMVGLFELRMKKLG